MNQQPTFGIADSSAPAPWLPPTINGGSAADATSSLLAQLYPHQQQNNPMAQPAKQQDKGNWLTRLLPTGGGLAGGAGGAALGTAILPGIGTVLGGILGAGLGSAGAKAGENVIEGQGAGNDVVREGLLGAGGQAVGGVLGKIGGKVIGGGLNALGKVAEGKAAAQASADAAEALSREFPDAALNAAARKKLGFGGVLDLANQTGVPLTAKDFVGAANAATGSNGYLTGVLDDIVRNSGGVDLTNFSKAVSDAISAHPELGSLEAMAGKGGLPKVAANTATNTQALFQRMLQNIGYGGEGSLTSTAGGDQALDLLRQVGKLGQKYSGAAPGSEGAALKNVYDSAYQNLRSSIYDRPELSSAVAKYMASPEDAAAVLKAAGGNQQLADFLTNTVNKAQSASDLLTPQSSFINMGKIGNQVTDYLDNVVGTGAAAKGAAQAAAAAGQPLSQLGGVAGDALLTKLGIGGAVATGNPLMALGAVPAILDSAPVKNAGSAIVSKLTSNGVKQGIAKTMTPTLLAASQFLAHSPNYVSDAASTAAGGNMNPTQPQSAMPGAAQGVGMSPNEQMLQMALVGLQNPLYAQTFAPLVQELMGGPIQKSTSANTALQGAEQAFSQAGGGQGMMGGLLSKLGGVVTGGPAKTYDAQRAQLMTQLNAMGIPTSAVPELTNTPEAAAAQWQTLQQLINSAGAQTGAGLLAGVR